MNATGLHRSSSHFTNNTSPVAKFDATGEVLLVKCEDDLWRPVAFISKAFNETERNYEIHDKEMLVVSANSSDRN